MKGPQLGAIVGNQASCPDWAKSTVVDCGWEFVKEIDWLSVHG